MRKQKAQSILEYTIILAAVVAGIIFAARTIVRPAVEQGFQDAASGMNRMTGAFNTTLGGGE